ncbi:MAG: universal stress protein [Sulfolobales archaeon]|nr:universal stress protein [Sulfolobales archaeon]MCX8199418.1 universal stress protein [Sulfolobales archaeon]MDW8170267.1 universal stress protein [Desulfurococcaceae archaeon]
MAYEYVREPSYEISFMYRRILVPIDGSESSLRALDFALDLSKRFGSKIVVLNAKPRGLALSDEAIEKARRRAEGRGVSIEYKVKEIDPINESPSSCILSEIMSGGYDMVVMGARGRSLIIEPNIGSTALEVVVSSPITIVIVR